MIQCRQKGINSLQSVYKGEDIDKLLSIESHIYNTTIGDNEQSYMLNMFQISCDIIKNKSLDSIVSDLNETKYGWNHDDYSEIKHKLKEQDDFIVNPFEVAEGVLQCTKCGGTRTLSYSRQVRSCDEGTSVYASCMACKNSWVHS